MKSKHPIWIPYADLMAALMLIFILVIVVFTIISNAAQFDTEADLQQQARQLEEQTERITELEAAAARQARQLEERAERITELEAAAQQARQLEEQTERIAELEAELQQQVEDDILIPISALIVDLYRELNATVADKYDEWGARLLDDLTITFENPVVLFDQDRYEIKQEFKEILDEWAPLYFSILTKDKYRDLIKEIKIEGHTARRSPIYNSYIRTIELSQHRAREILGYILSSEYFQGLPPGEQRRLEYIVSANGIGYGRAIDDNYQPVIESGKPISYKSRRVLFKVVIGQTEADVVAYVRGILNE